jgi:hypothetical protein
MGVTIQKTKSIVFLLFSSIFVPYILYSVIDSRFYEEISAESKTGPSFVQFAVLVGAFISLAVGILVGSRQKSKFEVVAKKSNIAAGYAVFWLLNILLILVILEGVFVLGFYDQIVGQLSLEEMKRANENPLLYFAWDLGFPICSWVILGSEKGGRNWKLARLLFLSLFITAAIEMARFRLLPLIFLYLITNINAKSIVASILFVIGFTVSTRGRSSALETYVIPNFERLERIANGDLFYPYSEVYYNCCSLFIKPPVIKRFIDFGGPESRLGYIYEQTVTLRENGLNHLLIWPTGIGYVFADLEWLMLLFFVVYGFLFSVVRRAVISREGWACALYPYFCFSLFTLALDNFIMYPNVGVYCFCSIVIIVFEKMSIGGLNKIVGTQI